MLKSNVAACHLRLAEWKQAVTAAASALEGLEKVVPSGRKKRKKKAARPKAGFEWQAPGQADAAAREGIEEEEGELSEPGEEAPADGVVELEGDDAAAARALAALKLDDERRAQVATLRAKSLLRRARANSEIGGWGDLTSAEGDYQELLTMPDVLPLQDTKFVRAQLATLPPRIAAARERDTAEMMGKLKELGNGLLRPFGLSTDMFKFEKDEKTGGYNMSMGGQK